MRIYEIAERHRQALDAITIDEETGEIIIPEEFANFQQESETAILDTARYIKELNSEIFAIKEECDRLTKRKRAIEKRVDYFKAVSLDALQRLQEKKVSDPTITVSVRKNAEKVVIDEGTELPDEYLLPPKPREPDKKKLKFDINEGVLIPGVYLVRESSLSIR